MSPESPAPLPSEAYRHLVRLALDEDVGPGDITTSATVDRGQRARGVILAKSRCIVAGLDIAVETFRQLDPDVQVEVYRPDGVECGPGQEIAEIRGAAAALLTAERTALNFLQRLSGIATLTRQFVNAAGRRIAVLDTRKTTPLLRPLEKYAVRAGGGGNHRHGLHDGILIKDNHIRLAGGVDGAIRRVRAACRDMPVEIEAQSLEQVDAAIEAGAEIILLDNLSTGEVADAVRRIAGRARTEVSGGITLDRIPELSRTGADFVSIGALTHSARAADLSLEIGPL